MVLSRKHALVIGGSSAVIVGIILFLFLSKKELPEVPVGILHSLTGDLSVTEKPIVDATLLAIEEINKKGGVLGRKIKPIVRDGKSNNEIFEKEAQELIEQDKVVALFGVWLSSSRAQVTKVVERYNNILFYPAYDEGLDETKHVVFVGSMANQGVLPGISWCFNNVGKRFFIMGTHGLFSNASSEISRLHIPAIGGQVVGQAFIDAPEEIPQALEKIIQSKPSVIINTIDTAINIPFFKALRGANIRPEDIPTMSFGFGENQLQRLDLPHMVGDYATRTYFQSIHREENIEFIKNFKARYGSTRVVGANMESAYAAIYLWAQAVKDARSFEPEKMKKHLAHQVFNAPGGILYLDETNHAWRSIYIGRIQYNGQFGVIWDSGKPIKPLIYPPYKDKKYWQDFVRSITKIGEHHG